MTTHNGPQDFGIPKIKLSTIQDPRDAVDAIANMMAAVHKEINHKGPPAHSAAIVGNETEILWNALLNYYDGTKTILINNGPIVATKGFLPSEDVLQNILESLVEIDLSQPEIESLPFHHPIRVLLSLGQVYENKRTYVEDPHLAKGVSQAFTQLLGEVLFSISKIDKNDMDLINGELTDVKPDAVTVSTGFNNFDFPVDVLMQKKGMMLQSFPIGASSSTSSPPPSPDKKMHERMVSAAKYLDIYENSLAEFATQPNAGADALFAKIQRDRPVMRDEDRPKVTVVGAGPSGAIAAIRAYSEGANVTLIEKRENYTRNNTFRFTNEIVDQFFKLFLDNPEVEFPLLSEDHPLKMAFNTKAMGVKGPSPLWGSGWHEFTPITIRDFEYLVNCWINLMENRDPDGMKVLRGFNYGKDSVNRDPNAVYVSEFGSTSGPEVRVPTDYLVGADGYQSQCRQDGGIQPIKMSTLANYGTYNYHPSRGDASQLYQSTLVPLPRKPADIQKLKALGWQHNREPVPRFFNTGNHPYIGIEIPDSIVKEYRRLTQLMIDHRKAERFKDAQTVKEERFNLMDAWGRATLGMFLTDEQIDDLVLKDCAVIDVQLQKSEKVTARSKTNTPILLIGDAAQSAHFQTGSGAIMGIRGGFDVGEFVHSIVRGVDQNTAIAAFEKSGRERGVALHEWAFNFPNGDELNVRPLPSFQSYRELSRIETLKADPFGIQPQHTSITSRVTPETSMEAQAKAVTISNITGRKR